MDLEAKDVCNDREGAEQEGLIPYEKDKGIEPSHVFYPWRRYFARMLDLVVYFVVWSFALAFVFHVNLVTRGTLGDLLDSIIILLMMLFVEPLLLKLWGTTLGKAIFGLRVAARDGRKLSYEEGLRRTWGVFGIGMGYYIPIYNLVRLWKSYKLCQKEEIQPWETYLSYTIKDTKWFRGLLFVLGYALCIGLMVMAMAAQQLPPNRGDLTVEEFAENYNYYARFLEIDLGNHYLNKNGQWVEKGFDQIVDICPAYAELPEIQYTVENGSVKGVSFSTELVNEQGLIPSYNQQIILLCFAMVGAQKEVSWFSDIPEKLLGQIDCIHGFETTKANLAIRCNTMYAGYMDSMDGYLYPEDTAEETYFSLEFSMNQDK